MIDTNFFTPGKRVIEQELADLKKDFEFTPIDHPKGKVILYGFDEFWRMFLAYRTLWLDGKFGGGKTLLAVLFSAKLLAENHVNRCLSNVPLAFSEKPEYGINCSMILDEAWDALTSRSAVVTYAAYTRKLNQFLIAPSVWDINPRLSRFLCYRVWNGYAVGVPVWVYEWRLVRRYQKDKGKFYVWQPENVFGTFPTKFIPPDDGGILEALNATYSELGINVRKKFDANHRASLTDYQEALELAPDMGEFADEVVERAGYAGGKQR